MAEAFFEFYLGTLKRGMGILPMSTTGSLPVRVSPVSFCGFLRGQSDMLVRAPTEHENGSGPRGLRRTGWLDQAVTAPGPHAGPRLSPPFECDVFSGSSFLIIWFLFCVLCISVVKLFRFHGWSQQWHLTHGKGRTCRATKSASMSGWTWAGRRSLRPSQGPTARFWAGFARPRRASAVRARSWLRSLTRWARCWRRRAFRPSAWRRWAWPCRASSARTRRRSSSRPT